ncbi:MAG: hypothetical protein M3273_09625, partial [Actinomycetota bacterium]|nr:hypothetical protein [Actinomycetota bacterium]
SGAGSASIEDGDVDGWSWGTGDNGSSHQPPPPAEHADVCVPAADPEPVAGKASDRKEPSRREPPSVAAPTMPSPTSAPAARPRAAPRHRERPRAQSGRGDEAAVVTTPPAASPAPVRAAAARDGEEGPPVTGLLGLGAAGLLALAVWAGSHRTRT